MLPVQKSQVKGIRRNAKPLDYAAHGSPFLNRKLENPAAGFRWAIIEQDTVEHQCGVHVTSLIDREYVNDYNSFGIFLFNPRLYDINPWG